MHTLEITPAEAALEAPDTAAALSALAARHRARHRETDTPQTLRHRDPSSGTWCYQTHIAVSGQSPERLAWAGALFYGALTLERQPWYPQFLDGASHACELPVAEGIATHQLGWGKFDLGLGKPRVYRQLLSLAEPGPEQRVIVARSVNEGPALPAGATLAYTLGTNGEVLFYENGCLHWHHICCTPGAALLPGRLDRWLMNALRGLRLDSAERATYQREAGQFRDWLHLLYSGGTSNGL
jgi:hypothetical protein